jgi:hypothetical protein
MIDDILIIDDAIPVAYADAIENFIFKLNFPWWYQADSAFGADANSVSYPSLNHVLVRHGEPINPSFEFFLPMIYFVCDKINYNITQITSAKSCLQLPLIMQSDDRSNNPHVDVEHEHLVALYYVNDSDGETIIYNETFEKNTTFSKETLTVKQRITPKKGRFLIFNGKYLHNSTTPNHGPRCIINFDIV